MTLSIHRSSFLAAFASAGLAVSASAQEARTGDGVPVLIAAPEASASLFEAPLQLKAGGKPIDMGEWVGYAGPSLHDANGDGLLDLYVGCFQGKILFAPNTGSRQAPSFGAPEFMQAQGQEIEISNW